MRDLAFGVLTAGAVLFAAVLSATPAAALPASNLSDTAAQLSHSQNVAWVCGPFRCWWTPRYYAPVVVAPRVYWGYPAYGYYGYGPYYSYRVVRPVRWYGVRRGYYRRW